MAIENRHFLNVNHLYINWHFSVAMLCFPEDSGTFVQWLL